MNYISKFVDSLAKYDPTSIGILIAVVIGILTLVLVFYLTGRVTSKKGVLVLGICGAGKTLLFSWLTHGRFKETYTSIKKNEGNYSSRSTDRDLKIIDLPGHERLRIQNLEENKSQARAIIFVIDSETFQKEIKDVAEFLYTVLSDSVISSCAPPVLIACNKQDKTLTKSAKVIQSNLEKEMNNLRVTKAAALQGTDNSSANNNCYLGKRNKDFEFSDLKPLRVEFAECSLHGLNEDSIKLNEIIQWIERVG